MKMWFRRRRVLAVEWEAGYDNEYLQADVYDWSDMLQDMFTKYGWQWDGAMGAIRYGRTELRVDECTAARLDSWIAEHWRRLLFLAEDRVFRTVRRPGGQGFARGMDLSAPGEGAVPVLEAHVKHLHEIGKHLNGEWSLAYATGLTGWQRAHRATIDERIKAADLLREQYRSLDKEDLVASISDRAVCEERVRPAPVCMCGDREPSMAHLLWTCSETRVRREGCRLRKPVNTAEERLLCSCVQAECPAPEEPIMEDIRYMEDVDAVVADELDAASIAERCAVLATDSGAKDGLCTIAVASGQGIAGAQLKQTEPTAADGELWALVALLHIIARVASQKGLECEVTMHLFTDSLSSLLVIEARIAPVFRYKLWQLASEAIQSARSHKVCVRLWWVPSHNKPWTKRLPPAEVGMARARALNDKADKECEKRLKALVRSTAESRKLRSAEENKAKEWSRKALSLGVKVWSDFTTWLASRGTHGDASVSASAAEPEPAEHQDAWDADLEAAQAMGIDNFAFDM
jgi:hypothetical protein